MAEKKLIANAGRTALVPKGKYDSNANYKRLDAVEKDGSSYVARKDNKGVDVTNEETWMLLCQKPIKGIDYFDDNNQEIIEKLEELNTSLTNYVDDSVNEIDTSIRNWVVDREDTLILDTNANWAYVVIRGALDGTTAGNELARLINILYNKEQNNELVNKKYFFLRFLDYKQGNLTTRYYPFRYERDENGGFHDEDLGDYQQTVYFNIMCNSVLYARFIEGTSSNYDCGEIVDKLMRIRVGITEDGTIGGMRVEIGNTARENKINYLDTDTLSNAYFTPTYNSQPVSKGYLDERLVALENKINSNSSPQGLYHGGILRSAGYDNPLEELTPGIYYVTYPTKDTEFTYRDSNGRFHSVLINNIYNGQVQITKTLDIKTAVIGDVFAIYGYQTLNESYEQVIELYALKYTAVNTITATRLFDLNDHNNSTYNYDYFGKDTPVMPLNEYSQNICFEKSIPKVRQVGKEYYDTLTSESLIYKQYVDETIHNAVVELMAYIDNAISSVTPTATPSSETNIDTATQQSTEEVGSLK